MQLDTLHQANADNMCVKRGLCLPHCPRMGRRTLPRPGTAARTRVLDAAPGTYRAQIAEEMRRCGDGGVRRDWSSTAGWGRIGRRTNVRRGGRRNPGTPPLEWYPMQQFTASSDQPPRRKCIEPVRAVAVGAMGAARGDTARGAKLPSRAT